jgi:FKBP-type peptidyl-prolyl cis-trans isomerase FkpA
VGAGSLIPGFEQGVVGMRVGGKRRVTIPPSLAYGSTGSGSIPPNTTIRFEIDLLSIAGK